VKARFTTLYPIQKNRQDLIQSVQLRCRDFDHADAFNDRRKIPVQTLYGSKYSPSQG
jgi:hypothetical protein